MRIPFLYKSLSMAAGAILLFPSVGFSAGAAATTTALGVVTATIQAGKPLELTARVISPAGAPAGNVSFYDGATLLGTATLNQIQLAEFFATIRLSGSHSLTAVYGGTSAYSGSTSNSVTVTVVTPPAGSLVRKVPAQYKSIQAAIDAAENGDTVLVAPGVYREHIDFEGKTIVVTSQAGPEKTIIDGGGKGSVVQFQHGETLASVLNGFTVRNGSDNEQGSAGGIYIGNATPSITSNIVTGNAGCGIAILFSSAYIAGNTVTNTLPGNGYCTAISASIALQGASSFGTTSIVRNTIEDSPAGGIAGISTWSVNTVVIDENVIRNNAGGGIGSVNGGNLVITGNLISGNIGSSPISGLSNSGGIFLSATPIVVNNTILGNSEAPAGAPLTGPQVDLPYFDANSYFANNIVVGVDTGSAVECGMSSMPSGTAGLVRNNDVYSPKGSSFGGGCSHEGARNGNISEEPRFVNPEGPDYSLLPSSPAIDAGTNAAPDLPVYDIDAQPRILAGKSGKLTVDMGAFEYSGLTRTTLSADSLEFGKLTIYATSAAKAITLKNKGAKPLHIEQIATTGDFSETSTCVTAFGVMPGSSCVINAVFSPIERGTRTGTLSIRSNSTAGFQAVHLSGTATGAVARLSHSSLTFARQQLFTSSAAQQILLGNSGNDVLTLSSVTASGDFAARAACHTIAPGKSCAIDVVFRPAARGGRTGTLTIHDDAVGRVQTAKLSGTGIGADISFSTSQLVFSGVPVFVVSAPQTLTVSNRGESTLNLKYQVTGPFAATGNCGSTVTAGASCSLQVTFNPSVAGPSSGSIVFTDNAAASPQSAGLSGTAGTPAVSLPGSITFPPAIVNTTATNYVDLPNIGTAYLTVSNVSITGPFTQSNNCIGTINTGQACTVTVMFSPTSTATGTGTITFTDTAAGGSQTISISEAVATTHTVPAITSVSPDAIQAGGSDAYLFIEGSNIFADSVVEWNGEALQSYPGSPHEISALVPSKLIAVPGEASITVFNPTPGGGTSNALALSVYSRVTVSAKDMVWDATRKVIYVSTDSNSVEHPNQIIRLDPATGKFGAALMTGNTPAKLAITADAKYLYANTEANNSVSRIDLATGKTDFSFKLGGEVWGKFVALDMAPVPGDDSSVVVSLADPNITPSTRAVQIFTNGKPRPAQVSGGDSYADYLLYLNGAGTLYASDTEDTGMTFSVFTIDAAGLSVKKTYSGLGGGQLATDGKNIFESNGKVISPESVTQIATLPLASPIFGTAIGWVTVDNSDGKAYYGVGYGSGQYQAGIYAVSTSTFKVLGGISTAYISSSAPDHILRFGSNGIAFHSTDGIFLTQTALVNAK